MKLFRKALPFVVLSSVSLFAADYTYTDSQMGTSISYPGTPVSSEKIQNSGAAYLFNTYCTDIGSDGKFKSGAFQVTKLRHRVPSIQSRITVAKSSVTLTQYMLQCENEAEYRVTCGNGLSYSGKLNWKTNYRSCKKDCKTDSKNWQTISLKDYNASTGKFHQKGFCKSTNQVPFGEIFEQWNMRKVALPKLKSSTKKLSRPVVFVPGHNSSFSVFGAKPVGKEVATNSDYLNGKVSGYEDGSLPDVIARDQKLDVSQKGINSNGLYFFTAPYKKSGNSYVQVLPHWKDDKAKESISFALYKYLEKILTAHYGSSWKSDASKQVDLVAHSQGGLVIREMLRGLRANPKHYPTGKSNAANHIRRVVTVNTPHFGSELADDYANIQKSKPAVAAFIKEIQDQRNREKKGNRYYSRELLSANVKKDLVEFFKTGAGKSISAEAMKALGIGSTARNVIGTIFFPTDKLVAGLVGTSSDVKVKLEGSYVGDFKLKTTYKYLFGLKTRTRTTNIDFLKPLRDTLWAWHVDGSHLATHSSFISKLTKEGYPKRPDGTNVQMRPMYSSDMRGLRNFYMNQLSKGSTKFCKNDNDIAENSCLSVTNFINALLYKSKGVKLKNIKSIDGWLAFYNNLMEEWLGSSDILVTSYSQQFMDKKQKLGPKYQKEFLTPKTYDIYLSQVPKKYPYNLVPHGDIQSYGTIKSSDYNIRLQTVEVEGAPRKGADLYCALDDSKCSLGTKKLKHKDLLNVQPIGGIVMLDPKPENGGAS